MSLNEYLTITSPFEPWISKRNSPSVYVVPESAWKEYKQKQASAEILELKKLIDGHKTAIESLESTVELLETEYELTETGTAKE